MDDGFAFLFDKDFNLSTSQQPQFQCESRLTKNSELVFRFLKGAPNMASGLTEAVKTKEGGEGESSIDQDSLSYVFFEKLWRSSKYHRSCLLAQWDCLKKRIEKQGPEFNLFHLTTDHVTGILYLCRILNTNYVVKFRALELYNRYLQQFEQKHADYLNNCSDKDKNEFYVRFEAQILLRMCTCILIASKLHADTQIRSLTTEQIKVLLAQEGFKFSKANVAHSELRVLETLDYRSMWVTPLDLMEQLLSVLDLPVESLKRVHYYSILLLEYCYTDLNSLRDRFLSNIKKSQKFTTSKGKITMPLKCAAIAAAALFIVSAETKTNHHKLVAKTAGINEEDVQVLAILMLDSLNLS